MLLYLSSYKLGNDKELLKKWIKDNGNKIMLIANSRDFIPDGKKKEDRIKSSVDDLEILGFEVERLDLREYFGKEDILRKDLENCRAFYVIGGNVYTLKMAMKLSGFDNYLKDISKCDNYLYAGYSAGICVLAPKLYGLDIVDKKINPYNDDVIEDEGIGILDFMPIPHYNSNHPESHLVDEVVDLYKDNNMNYMTLQDGNAIVIDTIKNINEMK